MAESGNTHVYILAAKSGLKDGPVKIGVASDIKRRMAAIQTSCPYKIYLVHSFEFPSREMALQVERMFHDVQASWRTSGEWFSIAPKEALFLMSMGIDAAFSVHMPDFKDIETVRELCGVTSAYEKLSACSSSENLQ